METIAAETAASSVVTVAAFESLPLQKGRSSVMGPVVTLDTARPLSPDAPATGPIMNLEVPGPLSESPGPSRCRTPSEIASALLVGPAHVDAQIEDLEGSDEDVLWTGTSSDMATMVHSLRVIKDTLEGEVLPTG